MLYHQITTNRKRINGLITIPCYKYELVRPSKGIVNLANLKIIFGVYLKKLNLLLTQNVQCKYLHAQ